jgi:signal transduction histidine kinase/ligand-binding sensor domain-containing protein
MRLLVRFALLLAVLALPSRSYALDPARTLSQYVHRIWQVQQGLPQASIYSIVETHDGYLWLGTQTGLVKFDGVRFTTIDEMDGLSSADIWVTHLLEDSQHALWIGTNQSGLLRLQDGVVTRYSQRDGLPSGTVQCLFADRSGAVWVCTPNGIAELTHGRVRAFGAAQLASVDIRAACVNRDGAIVVADDRARLSTWNGTRFVPNTSSPPESSGVQTMLCAADGALWVGTVDGLWRLRDGRADRLTLGDSPADNAILTLTESRDGSVLAGTKNGFSRIRSDGIESFRPQDGLSQSTVYSLYEDHEGSLWAATKHGLNQFLDGRGIPYTTSEGLPSNDTGPVLQDRDGQIWVGTIGGGLARFDGHGFHALTMRDGLASNDIYALAAGDADTLWVGTSAGLSRLRHGRVDGRWTTAQGLPANRIRALFHDRDGALLIATSGGTVALKNGTVRPIDVRDASLHGAILTFGEDGDRHLYAAPESGALERWTPGASAPSIPLGPALDHVDAMYQDADGLLWAGTLGDGLRLIDHGTVHTFSVLDGLFDDAIYGIVGDDHDRLWMACSKGIFSVSRSDLRRFAAGEIHRFVSSPYSPTDVLRTIECKSGVQPVAARMRDGRLWFSTIRGLLVLDPSHLDRRFAPPPVVIEEVTVDGERRPPVGVGALPPGRNNIDFRYTGLSFIVPTRITFRYRLDGFDRTWVDAGTRREAFYTNLPPGHFTFRAAACNLDDVCQESPAGVAFVIEPRLYQRAWFFPLAAVLLAAGGLSAYRLRIHRLRKEFDLILAERSRIARELHDTLLQGFAGITMAMQALASRLKPSDERRALEEIVEDAGSSLRAVRRSLAGLRDRRDASSGLAAAIADVSRQLTGANGIRLKLALGDSPRPLPADVEYNMLRIAQEAVLNAVRHSGARTLHVALDSTRDLVRLSVEDDGSGFEEADVPSTTHYGLIGMRERAAQIGATFHLTSAPGRGTAVSVVVGA